MPIDPQIDHDYNARDSVASFEEEFGALLALSEAARADLPCLPDQEFDPASGMTLDLYGAAPGRPVFLWVHGGYWRIGTKEGNAFAAPGLVAHDIAVAVMDYSLAPQADLAQIVEEVRRAVAWLYREGVHFGLETRRIHVGGSSAGGHLVGMLLADDWQGPRDLPEDVIGACLALSGIYDLEPLLHTQVNTWMNMTRDTVADLSPLRHIPKRSDAHLLLSVGGQERTGFLRQTADFANAWTAAGHSMEQIEMPEHNHFDITGTLSDPQALLVQRTRDAIRQFG